MCAGRPNGPKVMIQMKRFVALLMTVVMLSSLAVGQTTSTNGTYRLKPEDVITIQIYRVQDVNATLPVGIDGNVNFPFVGTYKVEGKTVKELEYELSVAYAEKLKLVDPIVSITIVSFRQTRASVTGTVAGGTFPMRPGDRILDLITSGGGIRTNGFGNLRRAYLVRRDNDERIPVDVYSLIVKNDSTQNYEVQDGDILIIPDQEELTVTVNGRVRNPGQVGYREGLRLSQVLAGAGEIERRSRMSRVQVFRRLPGQENRVLAIHCNMVLVHDGKDPRQDILLQPNDFIYVPDSGNLDFQIIGSVTNFLFYLDRFGIRLPGT